MSEVKHFTCGCCPCVCDDITLAVDSNRVVEARSACSLGQTGLSPGPDASTAAWVHGRPVGFDEGLAAAKELLGNSKHPLITGLANCTVEAQREAVALADRLGASIDPDGSSSDRLFPGVGTVSCTFGEMKNRAELVIAWGCKLEETHPRLLERFAEGGPITVVGEVTEIAAGNNKQTISMSEPDEFAAIWTLRAGLRNHPIPEPWKGLLTQIFSKRCTVILFGGSQRGYEAITAFASDLNEFTRCYVISAKGRANSIGATQVLSWQTGYPQAVNFARKHPRSFGLEFEANLLVKTRAVDLIVRIGGSSAAESPIPRISIGDKPDTQSRVSLICAAFPSQSRGTLFRADGVSLPLAPAIRSSLLSDFEVLQRLGGTLSP